MTEEQKQFCRQLIELSYAQGFTAFPIVHVAKAMGSEKSVSYFYDANTESGILWSFDSRSINAYAGYLYFSKDGNAVGVQTDVLDDLKHYCDYRY